MCSERLICNRQFLQDSGIAKNKYTEPWLVNDRFTSYPDDRIEYMIGDSNMNYIITQEQVKSQLDNFNGTTILIDGMMKVRNG